MWQDVRLNDLGEIAANIEQQQQFTKKRSHADAEKVMGGLESMGVGGGSAPPSGRASPVMDQVEMPSPTRRTVHYSSTTYRAKAFVKAQRKLPTPPPRTPCSVPDQPFSSRAGAKSDISRILKEEEIDPLHELDTSTPGEQKPQSGIGAALAAAPPPPMGGIGAALSSAPEFDAPPQHVDFSVSFDENEADDGLRPMKRRNSGANLAASYGSPYGSYGGQSGGLNAFGSSSSFGSVNQGMPAFTHSR